MNAVRELHQNAMEAADKAEELRHARNLSSARRWYKKAFEFESQAAQFYFAKPEIEPTRSVLYRSAAALALKAEMIRKSEQMAAAGLAGNPPNDIAVQLRDLIGRAMRGAAAETATVEGCLLASDSTGKMNSIKLADATASEVPIMIPITLERNMNFHVGTSGYGYKEWKGSFYPKAFSDKKMLGYYGERFRTVEINYTFRALPEASVLEGWARDVPADFQFVLKAPQQITHRKRLKGASKLVAALFEVAGVLKDRLGPILFQLPPNLKKDGPRLQEFLALLPSDKRVAFEFRHQSWFDDEIFGLLREHQAAMCIAEAEDDLKVPFVATADWGYLRLRRPDYSTRELKKWVKQVQKQAWRDAFVFFKHEDEGKGPQMAKRFAKLATHGTVTRSTI